MLNKIRIFFENVRNLIVWFPVIWKDRNYDSWFVYEIIIKKLELQAEALKTNGLVDFNRDYERMQTIIRLLRKVQKEDYIDESWALSQWSHNLTKEEIENSSMKHEKAKKLAKTLQFERMHFFLSDIKHSLEDTSLPNKFDIVTALHACDTATDDAIL